MHPSPVESDTLVLHRPVLDLDDFVVRPESYLVSIYDDPPRAREIWHRRLRETGLGAEGLVRLRHQEVDLIPPTHWDHLAEWWQDLVGVVAEFVERGEGQMSFPGQPELLALRRRGGSVLWSVGRSVPRVEPSTFLPGLVVEIERFLQWEREHVGRVPAGVLRRCQDLRGSVVDAGQSGR